MHDPTPGTARSPGITYQQLLDADSRPVPAVLRLESPRYLGSDDIAGERYTSHTWHRREVERLWMRVWQFACREEHITEPGDHIVYDIANLSFVVIRTATGEIKAFPNACLHRGRKLKDYDGRCSEIRCPFHGFAWTLEGELARVPAGWDFPHVRARADEFRLPECQVGTWAGFVFINPDPAAEPLADFLGELVDHFDIWDLADRYVQAHVVKVIEANWKVAQEAFCEAYHVGSTHPQILTNLGDTNSQVDVWENFARVITPGGTPSPALDWTPSEQEVLRSMLDVRIDQEAPHRVEDGQTARVVAAQVARRRWRSVAGERAERMSDAELLDSIDYTVFPNFHPWGAFNRIVYRFRPNGDDHRSSLMEVLLLSPFDGDRPPPSTPRCLGPHEPWVTATELGLLAKVFDQDTYNMCQDPARAGGDVQAGDHSRRLPGVEDPLAARSARTLDGGRFVVMRGLIHPITKALYEQDGDGNVRVSRPRPRRRVRPRRPVDRRRAARVRPTPVRLDRRAADDQQPVVDRRRHGALGVITRFTRSPVTR